MPPHPSLVNVKATSVDVKCFKNYDLKSQFFCNRQSTATSVWQILLLYRCLIRGIPQSIFNSSFKWQYTIWGVLLLACAENKIILASSLLKRKKVFVLIVIFQLPLTLFVLRDWPGYGLIILILPFLDGKGFDSKETVFKTAKKRNIKYSKHKTWIASEIPNVFSSIFYEKYTHEPFESKCFLSSFINSIGLRLVFLYVHTILETDHAQTDEWFTFTWHKQDWQGLFVIQNKHRSSVFSPFPGV